MSANKQILFLKNKARSLEALLPYLQKAKVKPLITYSVKEWYQNPSKIISSTKEFFSNSTVIVRSSASCEDSKSESMAGHFKSVANIKSNSEKELENAITEVVNSYGTLAGEHYFFIQEQVLNIKLCGVIFTCDLDSLAPYYVINYDESSNHDSVTSGNSNNLKTYVRARCSPNKAFNKDLENIIELAKELENLTNNKYLDIEFAIDQNNQLFLLQVRPIVTEGKDALLDEQTQAEYLDKIAKKALKISSPHPGLCGRQGVYSVMTDWNPAEMIGTKPRRLALSLYKELITDSTWAYQRDNYGYRNLRSFPLLISFLEQPYIDVRVSFNSFIPKTLDQQLVEKLVDYYMDKLLNNLSEHDKVEFNIVFSCYYLNLSAKLKQLEKCGFTELELDRIKYALLELTNKIIDPKSGLYLNDFEKLRKLESISLEILNSNLSIIEKIYWLTENCKRYGTLPFAGLARAGFIAVQMLNSMVDTKVLTALERDNFLSSLNTVGKQLAKDTHKLNIGQLTKESFLKSYGHLRPGTYDILSKRYDEAFDEYFSNSTTKTESDKKEIDTFKLNLGQQEILNQLLRDNGLKISANDLMVFITNAIEGREYGKFVFTKVVSEILKLMEELGERFSLSREDMSWIDVKDLLDLYSTLTIEDVEDLLKSSIKKHKKFFNVSSAIRLPQVISGTKDIYDFFLSDVEPNYITRERVTEIIITEEQLFSDDIANKIVFVKQADPGFDWIFTKGIAGLVTMYGGANSHMAIRCSELKIPAVIGCGEENFSRWSKGKLLEIDCINKQVRVIE
jgi:hypothetical protein